VPRPGIDVDFDGFVATAARRAGCNTHDVSTIPRIISGIAATPAVSPEIRSLARFVLYKGDGVS